MDLRTAQAGREYIVARIDTGDEEIREGVGKPETLCVAFFHAFRRGFPVFMDERAAAEGYSGGFEQIDHLLCGGGGFVHGNIVFRFKEGMDMSIDTTEIVHYNLENIEQLFC